MGGQSKAVARLKPQFPSWKLRRMGAHCLFSPFCFCMDKRYLKLHSSWLAGEEGDCALRIRRRSTALDDPRASARNRLRALC